MNRSVLVVLALGALVAAAVVAALVLSPTAPVDPGKGRPQKPADTESAGTSPLRPADGPRPGDPPPPVPGDPAITGTVAGPEGNPAAGAEVLLYTGERRLPAVTVAADEETRRRQVADLFQYRTDEVPTLRPVSSGPGPVIEEAPVARTMTDETGAFRLPDPPPGMLRLVARREALTSPEVAARRGSKVRLVLGETATLRGLIRSADDGRLLPGAAIRLAVAGLAFNAASGEDGTFHIAGLPGGPASVVTTHPEFAGDSRRDIALLPGREKELEIQLTKGLRLTVSVTVAGDDPTAAGPPLAGATVGLVRLADKVYAVGTTGEDGKVTFEGLPTGDWLVNASRDGHLPSGEEKIVLDREREWELSLEEAVLTTLKVVDERGVPVPEAEVFTGNSDEEFEQGASRRAGVTDEAGEFAFPFDWMGRDAVVFVMKTGFGIGIVQPQDPSDGKPITIVLRPGASLRGRVTGDAGQALAGAKVYVEVSVEDMASDDLYATVYADADGNYRLPCLPVGSVWVQVEADGHDAGDADFEVEPGSGEIVRDFRLVKAR